MEAIKRCPINMENEVIKLKVFFFFFVKGAFGITLSKNVRHIFFYFCPYTFF